MFVEDFLSIFVCVFRPWRVQIHSMSVQHISEIILLILVCVCVRMHAHCSAQRATKEGLNCFDLMPNVSYNETKRPLRIDRRMHMVHILANVFDECAIHTEIKADFGVLKMFVLQCILLYRKLVI